MKVKSESEVSQSCPTLHDSVDCSLPGSSTPGTFQALSPWYFAITAQRDEDNFTLIAISAVVQVSFKPRKSNLHIYMPLK